MQAVCEEVLPGAGANDHVTIGFAFLVGSFAMYDHATAM
jgi:hypothetical protein